FVDGIGFAANPALYITIPYDPVADFEPGAVAAATLQVLAVHPSAPATTSQVLAVTPAGRPNTVRELVALIRASPGKFSYASAGVGTGAHLTGELFRSSLNLDLVLVLDGDGVPAIAASVAALAPMSFGAPAATIPQVKDGRLRALVVGGAKRL